MTLRILFLKFRQKYFPRFAGKYDFNVILQAAGIDVGAHTIFYDPNSMSIDRQRPWMLHIGDYCKITKGTVILTHDYSRSVLRRKYGEIVGEAAETRIGDNVFIGMNSIILMGAQIGNNVIIGAGSVVSGFIPDDCVVAGNPAKIIRTLDEHYALMKKREIKSASRYIVSYFNTYGKIPNINEIGPFFPLFLERKEEAILSSGVNMDLNGDSEHEIIEEFMKSKPIYSSYTDFVQAMLEENL